MNLTPGSSYRLELESPKVARQVPSDLIVTIPAIDEDADVYDVRVFAFERPTKITIEGRVRFEDLQLF